MAKTKSTDVPQPTREQILADLAKRFTDPKGELDAIERDIIARKKAIAALVVRMNKDADLTAAFNKDALGVLGGLVGPYDRVAVDLDPRQPSAHQSWKWKCKWVVDYFTESWVFSPEKGWIPILFPHFKRVCERIPWP